MATIQERLDKMKQSNGTTQSRLNAMKSSGDFVSLPVVQKSTFVPLPSPSEGSETEDLRSEVRQRNQLASGQSTAQVAQRFQARDEQAERVYQSARSAELKTANREKLESQNKREAAVQMGGESAAARTLLTQSDALKKSAADRRARQDTADAARKDNQRSAALQKYQGGTTQEAATGLNTKVEGFVDFDPDRRRAKQALSAIQTEDYGLQPGLSKMTDDEKDIFLSAVGRGDWGSAGKYLSLLERDLNQRDQEAQSAENKQYAYDHTAAGTVSRLGAGLFRGLGYVGNAGQAVKNAVTGDYETTDPNSKWFRAVHGSQDLQAGLEQKAEDTGGPVARKAADLGLNVGDMAMQMGVGGLAGKAASLGLMGASVAGDTTLDTLERGGTTGQALANATAAGAAEILTEKLPVDQLFSLAKGTGKVGARQVILNLLGTMGSEGTQEAVTEIADNLADQAIMGDKSQYENYVRSLMEGGMDEQSARNAATKQFYLKNVGQAAAGGALLGGLMGAGAQAIGYANGAQSRREGRAIDSAYQSMQENGLFSDQATQARQQANKVIGLPVYPKKNAVTLPIFDKDGNQVNAESTQQAQKNASTGEAGVQKITMADFTDVNSPVWRNVDYDDTGTQADIMRTTHQEMVNSGRIVQVPSETTEQVGQSFPDLRSTKKAERVPILRQKMNELKTSLRQFLSGLKGGNYEFEVNGNVLEAKLYDTGIREVMEKVTQDKASMLYHSDQVFQNAQYLYSTPDYDGDPNIYRWNYFYTPVRIGDQTVGVRIAVRDMVPSADGKMDSQVYNWGIKTGATLDGGGPGKKPNTTGVSSVAPQDAALGTSASSAASSAPSIADSSAKGNTQFTPKIDGVSPEDSTGAAPLGFDPYSHLQNQSNTFHPDGEQAARQVDVPTQDYGGRNIPKSTATVMEAQATPDSAVGVIQDAIAKGEFSFDTVTDRSAMDTARKIVTDNGFDGAKVLFHQAAAAGRVSKNDIALGQVLLNNAMNAGDSNTIIDILADYSAMSTSSAQAMQAQRMLKKLSPEGQLYAVERSVENYQADLQKRLGDKAPEITVDKTLYQEFLDARDQSGRDAAMGKILQNVADQIPSSWSDKWNAWRYLSMLGNPRTHVRNIAGNAGFVPVRMVKDAVATVLESGVDVLTPGGIRKTKAALNPLSETDRALVTAAFQDLPNVEEQLLGSGKFSESAAGQIRDRQTVFKTKPLEALRKANSKAMDVEDTWFSKPAYAGALAGYLKANGISAQALTDGTVDTQKLDDARAYAVREAQRSTYRDANALSDFVAGLGYKGDNKVGKAANVLLEGILPFKRTPANILARGLEYSPAGLAKGLTYDLAKVHGGDMTAAEAIDDISAGLTGTGLLALGAFLAAQGLVSGGGGDDKEQDSQDDLTGGQSYALSVGGKNYTLDWLAPEALPFFSGVELWNAMDSRADGSMQFKDLLSAGQRITDPMLEMSMLQGLQDAITAVKYNDAGQLPAVAANAAVSYLSQGLPTLLGQAERTGESDRKTTFVDRKSGLPNDTQYLLGKTLNKIPGVEFQQMPYIDAWGRTESNGSTGARAFNNFLNPSYVSTETVTAADRELQRLKDAGQNGVFPQRVSQSDKPGGEYLSQGQYEKYAKTIGQTSYDMVSDLISSPAYKAMNDEGKANAVELAYRYARAVGKESVSDYEPDAWVVSAKDMPEALRAEFICYKVKLADAGNTMKSSEANNAIRNALMTDSSLSDAEKSRIDKSLLNDGMYIPKEKNVDYSNRESFAVSQMSDAAQKKWSLAKDLGYSAEDYARYYPIYSASGVKKDEKLRQLQDAGMTRSEAARFWNKMSKK